MNGRAGRAACYGRDQLIGRMLAGADERRCVLVFGGRQAGKTTMLRHAQEMSAGNVRDGGDEVVAVYVDLMALRYDAGPRDFYGYLLERAAGVCARVVEGLGRRVKSGGARKAETAEAFVRDLGEVLAESGRVRRVVFLLDEAGRVLGRRFPRAFQDNLFSMLYVDGSEEGRRVALVFSGAQELAGFCEDETSPLGSRAEQVSLVNLNFDAFSELAAGRIPWADSGVRRYLFEETGGHAGLAARMVEECAKKGEATGRDEAEAVGRRVAEGSRRLFEHWMAHFSGDARLALDRLGTGGSGLGRRALAQLLEDGGRDRFGGGANMARTAVRRGVQERWRRWAGEVQWIILALLRGI